MRRIALFSVLVGGVVDVVSSVLVGLPLGLYLALRLDLAHMPREQAHQALTAAMHAPSILIPQMTIGFLCSVLGGYVAAVMAGHHERLNGALASYLCIGAGLFEVFRGTSTFSLPLQILFLALAPVCSLAGGILRERQLRKTRLAPAAPVA